MSRIMEYVKYLSKEIGPRPAGTEEEQQAALYITEQFQKETGFVTNIEDFSSSSNTEGVLALLSAIVVAVTILAIIFPALAIPAFLFVFMAAVSYLLESFDQPFLSRVALRGASQNVVAKYQPSDEQTTSSHRHLRKIILVAHYDTGHVIPALVSRVESAKIPVSRLCVGGMVAAALFSLIRIFIVSGGGMSLLVLNFLSVIAILVCALPLAKVLLVRSAPFNEGAVNNATGTAALLEIAHRISRGSISEADLQASTPANITLHGEEAAREAGLIPEGVQIQYEAEQLTPPSEIGDYSQEERLLSAKAAVAAFTGRPVERRVYGSVADRLVNSHVGTTLDSADTLETSGSFEAIDASMARGELMAPFANGNKELGVSVTGAPAHDFSAVPGVTTAGASSTSGSESTTNIEGYQNAPSWFVAAQQNARKVERYNADEAPEIKRSRYNAAIENAERSALTNEEEQRTVNSAEQEKTSDSTDLSNTQEAIQDVSSNESKVSLEIANSTEAITPTHSTGAVHVQQPQSTTAGYSQSLDGTIPMKEPIPASEIRAAALASESRFNTTNSDTVQLNSQAELSAHSHASKLPSIDLVNPYTPAPTNSPSRSGILRRLRKNIPSFSGIIDPVSSETEKSQISKPASRVVSEKNKDAMSEVYSEAGSSDLRQDVSRAQNIELTNIPHSRSGNLINRLRKSDDEELADTPQQWLHVSDDFEPRSVGRARGGWESFRDDQHDKPSSKKRRPSHNWEGGAFSRTQLGYVDMRSSENGFADQPASALPSNAVMETEIADAIEQIYHFRNPSFNTEVWFVAMGSDGLNHDGARAFLETHRDEMRGSIIIEIESLGAGTLSIATSEGRISRVNASSRIKRYLHDATAATGISPESVSLVGSDSISSTLQKAGFQTMHLFGAQEDGRPALRGSAEDVFEVVDEQKLEEHVSFIYELLKR